MHSKSRFGVLVAVAVSVAAVLLPVGGSALAAATVMTAVPVSAADSVTFDGPVRATSYAGRTIFVVGDFYNAIVHGKKIPRARLAAIDATTGGLSPWAPSADNTVTALTVDPTSASVYLAGEFTTVNGQPRAGLAQLDFAGNLLGFAPTVAGTPTALATGAGRLFVGGLITAVNGLAVQNLAAFTTSTGAYDPSWVATTNGSVRALLVDGDRLYVGGKFHNVNSVAGTSRLAALSLVTGVRDAGFAPVISNVIYSIAVGTEGVFVAMGGYGGRAIGLTTAGQLRWAVYTDGDVQAIAYLAGVAYFGGHFDNICGAPSTSSTGTCVGGHTTRVKLAAANAATGTLLSWNPRANGVQGVEAMAAQPSLGAVAVGGEFTTIGGTWQPRFALFG